MSENTLSPALLSAINRVLKPVARLMLSRGITLPMAVEIMKRVFVNAAEHDFKLDDKTATDSRISLLTGVHRKDVKRLRELPDIESDLPEKISLGSQIVSAWISKKEWQDENGQPRVLPRLASAGGDLSFEQLVASVSRDIRPRPVLDECLRLGIVSLNRNDEVTLRTEAYIPQNDSEEKLAYFGHNLGDHAAAATDNVLGGKVPWFERSLHENHLTPAQVENLRARVATLGMKMLTELDAEVSEAIESNPAAASERVTCGIYFYSNKSE